MADIQASLLDNWSTLVTLLFSGIVTWSAVINTRLSTRLADAELLPAVSVYLELDKERRWFFDLVVRNSGRGVARNVRFEVIPDIPVDTSDPESRLTRVAFIREGLGHLASGQEMRTALNSFPAMVKTPIEVNVSYDPDGVRGKGQRIESRYVLDVREYEGTASIGQQSLAEIADSMSQLAGDVRNIKLGGSFANLTVTVKRQYLTSSWVNRMIRRWFHPIRRK